MICWRADENRLACITDSVIGGEERRHRYPASIYQPIELGGDGLLTFPSVAPGLMFNFDNLQSRVFLLKTPSAFQIKFHRLANHYH